MLADRTAIISDGKLICCGSTLFLKNKYNTEYCLSFMLDSHKIKNSFIGCLKG